MAAVLALSGLVPPLAATEGSALLFWQDNVTNTTNDGGRLSAWMTAANAADEWRQPFARDDALYYGVQAQGEACFSYPRLDALAAGPSLALVHKFGLGAYAPLVRLEGAATGIAARQSFRSGWKGRVALAWSRRFTAAAQLALGAEWARTDARAAVFSTTTRALTADLTYDFTDTWRAKAHLAWRNGDVVSYYRAYWTAWGWQPAGYYGAGGSYSYGTARGQLVDTFDEPYLAYRPRAHTWSLGGTLSPAIGRDTALVLSYEVSRTENPDVRYWNQIVSVGLVHRF